MGVVFHAVFGGGPWAVAAAVATALALMQLTRTIHSPAGADPIIVMAGSISWPVVAVDLAVGLVALWVVAILLLNGFGVSTYGRRTPVIGPIAAVIAARFRR